MHKLQRQLGACRSVCLVCCDLASFSALGVSMHVLLCEQATAAPCCCLQAAGVEAAMAPQADRERA